MRQFPEALPVTTTPGDMPSATRATTYRPEHAPDERLLTDYGFIVVHTADSGARYIPLFGVYPPGSLIAPCNSCCP